MLLSAKMLQLARSLDREVKQSLHDEWYESEAADLRELLEQAAKALIDGQADRAFAG